MVKLGVDKAKVFFMLYKEARPFYDAFSAAEKKKLEESVETSKVKYPAEHKAWKEAGGIALASITESMLQQDAVDISNTFAREKCVAFSGCSTIRNKRQTYFFNPSGKEQA